MKTADIAEYIKECSKMPFRVITAQNSRGYTVFLTTPMGEVKIESLRMTYGILSAPNQVEKNISDIVHEVYEYEKKSKEHLWEVWLLQAQSKNHDA